ncbi:MAG: hypothetical protein LUH58_04040 [Lachnospiraceae bacterium]|nr:hypothetical protein [Lachnospiraceae bacterium]
MSMTTFLYSIVEMIAEVHSRILSLNDAYEYNFSDKELHFLVIGLLGMVMIFVVYPVFKYLASTGHVMVISWVYVFTLIIVITFAIEIGQRVTNTGNMEFADIMFGLVGFLFMFFIFSLIRGIYHGILELCRYYHNRKKRRQRMNSVGNGNAEEYDDAEEYAQEDEPDEQG